MEGDSAKPVQNVQVSATPETNLTTDTQTEIPHQNQQPPLQKPPESIDPIQKNSKNIKLIIFIAVLAFFVAAVSAMAFFSRNNSDNLTKETETEKVSIIKNVVPSELEKGVYALIEDTKLNVYATSLDGQDKEIILTRDVGETNSEPLQLISASVSPDGTYLAYKLPPGDGKTLQAPSDVVIMRISSTEQVAILNEVVSFEWRDSNLLFISKYKQAPAEYSAMNEAPLYPRSNLGYFIYNVETQQEVAESDDFGGYNYLSHVNDKQVLTVSTSPYGGVSSQLYLYDTVTKESTQIELDGNSQISTVTTNPNQTRTVVSLLPSDWGLENSCNIYELNNTQLIELVKAENYDCALGRGSFSWNGNDEIFYNRGTGPNGIISTSDTTESGLYILKSIYKYNFITKSDEVVLQTDDSSAYQIFGVLPGKALAVYERSVTKDEATLQFRDIDGSNPIILYTESKTRNDTPYFIGWTY